MVKHSTVARKKNPKPIQLTNRDVEIFRALHRFTVLTIDQVVDVVGGGRERLRKRLRELYDHGYLARPPVQREMYRYEEERPLISALGNKGAAYLREMEGYSLPSTVNWDRKANERGGLRGEVKLRHDVETNSVIISLEKALRAIDGIEVYNEAQILEQAPEVTKNAKKPFSIPCSFTWTDGQVHERQAVPDGTLAYVDTRGGQPIRAMLFIEYDREMDVKRSDPKQSSIVQKVACYGAMNLDKTTKQRFGFDNFRVLFVTTGSQKHLQTILEGCKDYRDGHPKKLPSWAFFFSTREAFHAAENPLDKIWQDGDGKPAAITYLG